MTKEKISEIQLPEKKELLESIFNTALVAICITDKTGIVRQINPEFTRLFGYSEDETIGKEIQGLIRHEEGDDHSELVEKRMKNGEGIDFEATCRTRNGGKIYVSCRLSPIFINNIPLAAVAFYTDITDRKKAENNLNKARNELELRVEQRTRELKESEKRFRDLFEQSIDAIFIHKEGVILDVNNRVCEMLGYSREQLLGMTVLDLHTESIKQKAKESVERSDKLLQIETEWIKADGTMVDVEISSNMIDSSRYLYQVIARDITERKEAEKKLKLSEQLNRALVENIDFTLNLIDTDYNLLMANPISAKRRNIRLEDMLGKKCYEVFEKRNTVCPHCVAARAITTGKIQRYERTVDMPGYGLLDMEFQFFPVSGEDGKVNAFIESVRDFTEARKAAKDLERAKEAAVQANTAKSEFLANMSHEIRTPLNGVMGVLNLLLSTNPDDEQLDLIETGKRSADSLLTVINDVLDFSKIEAGELDLEILDFDLRSSIAEIIELPAMQAHDKGLEIIYDIHPDIPSQLRGDPGRLRQILLNLTSNAIKFTEKGEIFISVSLVDETDQNVTLKVEVKDTGIGIPEDKLKIVFDSFRQTDASTTRMYGGTGLGLSISKKLAELMGGEIGVTSKPGVGSAFWFTSQFDKQPDVVKKQPEPPADILGKRFLIVDDNNTNLAVLKGYIEAWGCSCDLANTGEVALSMMNAVAKVNAPFDAVITDMRMPEMDGVEFGKRIKNDPILKDTPIVMLTSQGIRGDASRMVKIGFAAYLTKPIRRSQLFDCLAKVLVNKNLEDQRKRAQIITKHTISEEKRSKIRILLVEDNIVNQKLALRLVEKFGFRVDCAANGREAIKALESFNYDIVLMDVQMPEMDGLEATKIIRDPYSNVLNHNVKIIAMTAHAMQGDKDRCINAGMNDYTNKPIQPQELLHIIEKQIKIISSENM